MPRPRVPRQFLSLRKGYTKILLNRFLAYSFLFLPLHSLFKKIRNL